jgi:hypothetical protein
MVKSMISWQRRALLWKPTVLRRQAGSHILKSHIHAQRPALNTAFSLLQR